MDRARERRGVPLFKHTLMTPFTLAGSRKSLFDSALRHRWLLRKHAAIQPGSKTQHHHGDRHTNSNLHTARISHHHPIFMRQEHHVGCSKRPDFSPTQPRRAKTRPSAGKAAANYLLLRGGGMIPPARVQRGESATARCASTGIVPATPTPFQHPVRVIWPGTSRAGAAYTHRKSVSHSPALCRSPKWQDTSS